MQDYECKLKEYRELKKLTRGQLGRQAGLSTRAVGRLERVEYGPTLRTAVNLARALGVPVEELFVFPQENPRGR